MTALFIELICHFLYLLSNPGRFLIDLKYTLCAADLHIYVSLAFVWYLWYFLCFIIYQETIQTAQQKRKDKKVEELNEKRKSQVFPSILCTSPLWIQKCLFCTFCVGVKITLSYSRSYVQMQEWCCQPEVSGASFSYEVLQEYVCFESCLGLVFRVNYHFCNRISSYSS